MVLDAATKDKVRQQVEFYFSDSNLPRDAFLQAKTGEDPEGFVDIALLCIFSRMQQLLKIPHKEASKVPEAIIKAVAVALEPSEDLVLSENKKRVRRAQPMDAPPEEVAKAVDERSLYVAPFPFDTPLDNLMDFFRQHGTVNCVRMRRHLASKDFKGSVFVEFGSKEEAERVAGLSLVFEGAPLKMEPKLDYMKRKVEERHARPNSPHNEQQAAAKARPAKAKKAGTKRPAGEDGEQQAEGEGGAGEEEGGEGEEGEGEEEALEYDPGCVVEFEFGEQEFVQAPTFALVRDSFGGKEAGVKFVDYEGGRTGRARFGKAEQAQEALATADGEGSVMVAGYSAKLRVLEGEEEEEYMRRTAEAQKAAAAKERPQHGRGGGGRGGRGRGRGSGKRPFRGRGGGRGKRGRR